MAKIVPYSLLHLILHLQQYLLRVEQIGLHTPPEPQFFVSCAQINILNGGNGNPPMVEIPGHIDPDGT